MRDKKANYCKLAEKYNLKILESFFIVTNKDPKNVIDHTITEIEKPRCC